MQDVALRTRAVFEAALEITCSAERERFVVERCAGDVELECGVREMLGAVDEVNQTAMDDPPLTPEIEAELARLKPEEAGDRIGPYKLLEQIGEGGFGSVWLADQLEPVKRRVALKIIKLGMDTKEVIGRFEQERQALAMMEHPNIAKVLDAGATQTGRPFFVMELVRGIPITTYCDQSKVSTRERLRLFVNVCQAIQHAHQKGIIHRDIKPTNILVALHDGAPVPKVIDFGVAKATQQRLTELTVYTQFEQMIGTPLYMSPEQAEMSGLDVDTRSDIYSLGVLLYELLTGRTPFTSEELLRRGYEDLRRMIRELEPPKPSTALSTMEGEAATTVAQHQQLEPAKLAGLLRGDLDWIVMKALEKDRSRRYETANGLAMDIERHLAGEPIAARPPTTFYRLGKMVRRNKLAFAAAAGVMLALLAGAAFSIWQARSASHDAVLANVALQDLQKTAPAFAAQAHTMAAREDFDGALAKLDTAAKLRPDVAEYRVLRGDILQSLLRLAEAAAEYRAALQISPDDPRAKANVALCDKLLAANADPTKLTPESLRELAVAMKQENRSAAQRLAVARRLGDEKTVLLEYWAERLTDLPLPPERPIAERLTLRDDGLLALDLQGTQITDLAPLESVPLGEINATGCEKLTDLAPAGALPLVVLKLGKSGVTDLAPLAAMRSLKTLDLAETKVRDLAPLNGLALESLNLYHAAITDLAALKGVPLHTLNIDAIKVTTLAPLAGMPLKHLSARGVKLADFSPLAGSPLETCIINLSKVADLAFLKGAPLRELNICCCADARNYAALANCKTLEKLIVPPTVLNLSPEELDAITALRGLPALSKIEAGHFASSEPAETVRPGLLGIQMGDISDADAKKLGLPDARGTSVSRVVAGAAAEKVGIKAGDVVREVNGAPIANSAEMSERIRGAGANAAVVLGVWRDGSMQTIHATLGEAAADVVAPAPPPGKVQLAAGQEMLSAQTAAEFWRKWDLLITVAKPLRAAGFTVKANVLENGTLHLDLKGQPMRDLSILADAPISHLEMGLTKISDLSPVRTMKLQLLGLWGSPVTDISPLRGLPLTHLNIGGTSVTDLSPLEGMPLAGFSADGSTVTDFAPLAKIPTLTSVLLPMPKPGAPPLNIEPLRSLPKLERLSFALEQSGAAACTAKDFWAHWDGLGWMRALQYWKIKFTAEQLSDGRWKVVLNDKRVSDCSIFKGGHIAQLGMNGASITDISPLRDIALEYLELDNTPVADLAPLRGSALSRSLTSLHLYKTNVTDFSPLAECVNLRWLDLRRTALTDISFLRALKVCPALAISETPVTDISALMEMPALESVFLPWGAREVEKLRALPKLRSISYTWESKQTAEEFWQMRKELPWVADLGAKGITAKNVRREDGLWSVTVENQPLEDLTPLRGSPLHHINMINTKVASLEPLRGMPLTYLAIGGTKVTDLSPLAGMKLDGIQAGALKNLKDISVLRGMPLRAIYIDGTSPDLDLSPIADCDTLELVCLPKGAKNIEQLRRLPRVQRMGYAWDSKKQSIETSVEEFWAAYDRAKKP
jgi:serine/threonine protein kinase/Leucine-rich repeat (LRR) protein/predicted negative regulator of RcsB-dependent stress response